MEDQNKHEVIMNPNTPVIYTDSVFITKTPFGVNLEIAQTLGSQQKQQVVARVGMSLEHAKALLDVMKKTLSSDEGKSIGFRTGDEK